MRLIAGPSSLVLSRHAVQQPGGELSGPAIARLILQMADSDSSALSELYDRTSNAVFGLALRIVRDRSAAEDIVIQVYARAWSKAASFDPTRGSAIAWLLALTRHRAIDALRARSREPQCESIDIANQLSDPGPGPEESLGSIHRRQAVHEALAALPAEQRQVIALAFFGGLSHGQIADRTELPLGTIKTRIRTGLNRLRTLLAELDHREMSAR